MADRSAVEEIREALSACSDALLELGAVADGRSPVRYDVVSRQGADASARARAAVARLVELPTPEAIAESDASACRLELRLGTIRMYLENPKTVDPSVCAATCDVFRAVVRAVEAGEMRAEGRYIHGRGDERDDVRWAIDDQIATADPSDARWIAALNRLRETIDSEHHVDRAEQAKSATSAPPPDPHNHADELFRPTTCAACAKAAKGIG